MQDSQRHQDVESKAGTDNSAVVKGKAPEEMRKDCCPPGYGGYEVFIKILKKQLQVEKNAHQQLSATQAFVGNEGQSKIERAKSGAGESIKKAKNRRPHPRQKG